MSLLKRGALFTSEPHLNRALASEMRFDPAATSRFVNSALPGGASLGVLQTITCEGRDHANVDILLEFDQGTVGIECKIGHGLSEQQWKAEIAAVDHLIVVAKMLSDVPKEAVEAGAHRYTWERIFSFFTNSRVGIHDVLDLRDEKRLARRQLQQVDFHSLVPSGWTLTLQDGDGGYPSVVVESPHFGIRGDRFVTIQIEQARGKTNFVANVGIKVVPQDFSDFQDEPEWVTLVRKLGFLVEKELVSTDFPLSNEPGRSQRKKDGTKSKSQCKMELAKKFNLPHHYATGYTNSYVGIRTKPIAPARLAGAASVVVPVVVSVTNEYLLT